VHAGATTPVTIVKLAQTGLAVDDEGDAAHAARLAGCESTEFARFPLPADPWNAALDAGAKPLEASELAARLATLDGALVVEGSGGAAVPLNERESIADVAALARLPALLVVGLRLGCISHAVLTAEYLRGRGITLLGALLTERFAPVDAAYRAQVERALRGRMTVLGTLAHEQDLAHAVAQGAGILASIGDLVPRD
jgi:dethiobiotin synthetase